MQYNAALAQKAAEKAFMYSNQVLTCHALVKQQLYRVSYRQRLPPHLMRSHASYSDAKRSGL